LASLCTAFAFSPPAGYILFFDEIGERPYRLDRMVTQLKQTGLLSRAAAIVIGELPQCDEPSGDPTAAAVMAELLDDFPGPVVLDFLWPHFGPRHDAAVRCDLPGDRRRPASSCHRRSGGRVAASPR
jgi:muramoyltetrapeptide carboxypeptidase LdcA involved in peptidoglycan recycling